MRFHTCVRASHQPRQSDFPLLIWLHGFRWNRMHRNHLRIQQVQGVADTETLDEPHVMRSHIRNDGTSFQRLRFDEREPVDWEELEAFGQYELAWRCRGSAVLAVGQEDFRAQVCELVSDLTERLRDGLGDGYETRQSQL